jgi:transposase
VEILLSAAETLLPPVPGAAPAAEDASPVPPATFDVAALVGVDLLAEVPADVAELLALLPRADLYLQDELEIRLHPTLTRCWSHKGRVGQRLVQAPGQNRKVVAFGAVDWRDGWTSVGFAFGRTAEMFVKQLDHLVARSHERGRVAIVLADNANTHTARGAKLVRQAIERHGEALRLVYTPAYDPEANPIERLWQPLRRAVTHNHRRAELWNLYEDLEAYFDALDVAPARALRHIGSPFASIQPAEEPIAA